MTTTLMEIEQTVAPRIGYYRRVKVALTGATSPPSFISNALKSTIDRGEPTPGTYALRRGLLENGAAVPSFNADDRVREIKEYDPLTGRVTPDRDYAVTPATNEMIEFTHLHPDEELRTAVRAGLRRCYFPPEVVDVTLSSASYERNLSTSAAWLTSPSQLYDVLSFTTGAPELAKSLRWWEPIGKSGALWLRIAPDPYPSTLRLIVRRPHFTYVNSLTSTTGPTADADILQVDLAYATAAAHIEAWRLYKAKLAEASAEGRGVTQKEAAEEFTFQAGRNFAPPNTPRIMLSRPSRIRAMDEVVF